MTNQLFFVATGGALGATCRFVVSFLIQKRLSEYHFPLGTLIVNVVGCFLIGLLLRTIDSVPMQSASLRSFLIAGFLGALTTFSTFGYETYALHQTKGPALSLTNILANMVLALGAVVVGIRIGKWLME